MLYCPFPGSIHHTNDSLQRQQSSEYDRGGQGRHYSNSSPRHTHYSQDTPTRDQSINRSNSWQGSNDRDRSYDRGQSSRGRSDNRDLSVLSLTGQSTPAGPSPRDMDPGAMQARRERVLHQQDMALNVHRHRYDRQSHTQNPYDRGSRQPWQQSGYRRH